MPVRRLALLFFLLAASGARAQGQMEPGVVWQPPVNYEVAADDLRHMRQIGVRAVRTVPIEDERLLTLADTLGLTFYQELPIQYSTGPELEAALPRLQAALGALFARSRGHASGRVIGLARRPDTSDPRTCAALQRLAESARAQRPDVRLYYVASLVGRDRCADAVDFVLLPTLDEGRPLETLTRWQAAHPNTPAGLIVGWWSDPQRRGRRAPHSPEQAAARLDALFAALAPDTTQSARPEAPVALFVYRWRETDRTPLDLHPPHRSHYGLLDGEGHIRPIYEVVQGRFTGEQDVFTMRGGGDTYRSPADVLRLMAWGVLLLLGIGMVAEPRFRQMAQRYFRAHGFYRESVRDARGALLLTTLLLLAALGLCVGLIAAVLVSVLSGLPAFTYLASLLSFGARQALAALVEAPWGLVLVGALVFAIAHLATAVVYALAVRRRYLLGFTQALALGLWSRWPLLPLAFTALVAQTLPAPWATRGALLVGALAVLTSLLAMGRTLYDLVALTRVPAYVALALCLIHPFVLLALGLLMASFDYGEHLRFFVLLARDGIG